MVNYKYFMFILIFFAVSNASAQIQDSNLLDQPKSGLAFDHMEYDFGIVKSDTIVTHVYTFKNVSLDTIRINQVGTS
ncbi:MAG: DUF1573 domain-containing protein [Calditrichaceae bacterium]|nr:DUF1573 domain-containing protein [Calditrichaceae bacterium]